MYANKLEEKVVPFKEIKLRQTLNGIVVTEPRIDGFGTKEWVFSEMKDLKAFIGKNFLDAKTVEKLMAKEITAEKKLLARKEHKEK